MIQVKIEICKQSRILKKTKLKELINLYFCSKVLLINTSRYWIYTLNQVNKPKSLVITPLLLIFGSIYLDLDTILYVFNLGVNKEGKKRLSCSKR